MRRRPKASASGHAPSPLPATHLPRIRCRPPSISRWVEIPHHLGCKGTGREPTIELQERLGREGLKPPSCAVYKRTTRRLSEGNCDGLKCAHKAEARVIVAP